MTVLAPSWVHDQQLPVEETEGERDGLLKATVIK